MSAPVLVMNTKVERETGRKAQLSNITAAKTVADVIRTCLGPRSMLKMLLDPMGGILLTNDGNAILREVEVAHPAAKSMIELSRTQDEEVGDGTTSVIVLAGEVLATSVDHLERNIHPIVIIRAYKQALEDAIRVLDTIAKPVDVNNEEEMLRLVKSTLGTKFSSRWSELMCSLALKAVRTVVMEEGEGDSIRREVDIKRYARVEKVPGGEIEESRVLDGVMVNKDVTHPKMRRRIENPRIVLLDCPLEYKKGESQTNIEGVSDLAQHYLLKANITVLRRMRKTDNNRVARATGATIVNRVEDLKESDVGTKCGLFHVEKIADEYFSFLTQCQEPKACTILLRGPSKDIINEVERNLQDAMCVARNVFFEPRLLPGGGATEMAVSVKLGEIAKSLEADAMEVIPRTLVQNCGGSTRNGQHSWGIDGCAGTVVDMEQHGIWEPYAVKVQTIKTAIESACLLLRVDDIVSGVSRGGGGAGAASGGAAPGEDGAPEAQEGMEQ
ncbi:T-complex protein 1 subunit gamma [Syncephalis plumigaleata]|nr:T-complex protein 1 subunit gamma [Syncephalis plumigaleata]